MLSPKAKPLKRTSAEKCSSAAVIMRRELEQIRQLAPSLPRWTAGGSLANLRAQFGEQ
jgi:hypothetical protein